MVFGDCSVCDESDDEKVLKSQEPFRLNASELRARGDQSSTKGETTTSARHDHFRKAHSRQSTV